jgi:Fe-S-cluster containining protein
MTKRKLQIKDSKINFCCKMHHCQNSCCGPFSGITDALNNIDNRPFNEIVLTPEDYQRLYDNGYANLIEEGYSDEMKKRYYKMALEKDGTCKAFVNGKCSIHDFSPTLCKAFPFYFDMFSGLCAISCDGFCDDYWTDIENYRPYFENARKMYEFWLDFYSESQPAEK